MSATTHFIVRVSSGPALVIENLTRRCVIADRIQSARDSAQRRRGLLDTTSLEAGAGLWINPCEAIHTFGMHVSLDVVFLDRDLRVRKIAASVKPNRIAFCLTATSALEIGAGVARSSGTECGDQLAFRPAFEATGFESTGRIDARR